MKPTTLYPPGGGEPVRAHPTQVEAMKASGWTEENPAPAPVAEDPEESEDQTEAQE